MSGRYDNQLRVLGDTYRWALDTSIDGMEKSIGLSMESPLITVGSGGSLTVANLAALLNSHFTGQISRYMTPLEFINRNEMIQNTSVFLFTGGGRNPDILSTFKEAICREPYQLTIVCGRKNSALSRLAHHYDYTHLIELEKLPFKRDGYLSANSLLAFSTLLVRSYISLFENDNSSLPIALEDLVCNGMTIDRYLESLQAKLGPILAKETLVALYYGWSQPAGIDLESKFTEAALSNVRVSDYRNFGHGRHYWLARHQDKSSVIAFADEEANELSRRTIKLIPSSIPVFQLSVKHRGPMSSLAHLCNVLYLTKLGSDIRNIDPGRLRVPRFGSRLYNLQIDRKEMTMYKLMSQSRGSYMISILRKCPETLRDNWLLDFWKEAFDRFVERLEQAEFKAIVFDYDGTLCDPEKRYLGPSANVVKRVVEILEAGIGIGIATGRGKSVRKDLQSKIPTELWNRVVIGYYNGGDIALLSENDHPNRDKDFDPLIESVCDRIRSSWVSRVAEVEARPNQITISKVERHLAIKKLREILISMINNREIRILESTHSLDILAPDISKCLLLEAVKQKYGDQVLCIGDKGRHPGNDFELLQQSHSLSVFEVSPDLDTCWNLASPGLRYSQATCEYLDSLVEGNGHLLFKPKWRPPKNE